MQEGLSRPRLEFGGGSVDILRHVLHCARDAESLVARTKRRDKLRHVLVTFQSTEALDGFEDGGDGPPQHHLTSTPPFDVSLHMSGATDQALDGVGRRE